MTIRQLLMRSKSALFSNFSRLLVVALFIVFVAQTEEGYAQFKNNRKSSITGNRFKPNKKSLSQQKRKKPRNYINSLKGVVGFGSAAYYGELCDGFDCMTFNPTTYLGAQYRVNESLVARSHVGWLQLDGSDVGSENERRNLSFRSNNFEFAVDIAYNIFEFNKMYRRRHLVSPYVFLGMGFVTVNPKAEYNGEWYALRDIQTEGVTYSGLAFIFPYGAGVNFKVTPHLDIGFEATYRWTFTDYLDDVSDSYDQNKYALPADDVSRILTDRRVEYAESLGIEPFRVQTTTRRGNPDKNDGYISYGFRLEYTLKVTHQTYNINSNVSRFRIIKSIKRK